MAEEKIVRKKTKMPLIISLAAVFVVMLAVVAVVALIAVQSLSPKQRLRKQLELGDKYLSELDYEQAIVAYRTVIEIDPKNVEAYLGLAEAYVGLNDYEEAVNALTDCYDQTDHEGIPAQLTETYMGWAEYVLSADGSHESDSALAYALEILQEGYERTNDDHLIKRIEELTKTAENNDQTEDSSREDSVERNAEENKNWGNGRAWTDREDITPHEEGGYVVFGAYEQDDDLMNGPEPIEWEVLDVNEKGTLLISRYVLDAQAYNEELVDITWAECTLRQWMNDDFLNSAFTTAEQEYINEVTIPNPDSSTWGTPGGEDTTDRIFALSTDEVEYYYDLDMPSPFADHLTTYDRRLLIQPTPYAKNTRWVICSAISQEKYDEWFEEVSGYESDVIGLTGAGWWLRSPGGDNRGACLVDDDGGASWVHSYGVIDTPRFGVRPALYITQK